MADETLFTVVQISDLHFGSTVAGSSSPGNRLLTIAPWFEGWLDHHRIGIRELYRLLSSIEGSGTQPLLVVSGDVTANGAARQFALVDAFLGGGRQSPFGFGLDRGNWVQGAVPGNHDHWPGSNTLVGPSTPGLGACFNQPFPIVHLPIPLAHGRSVRFIMVDSDADVGWASPDRVLGRGRFVSQLKRAKQELDDVPILMGETRVMVVHHAIADDRTPVDLGPVSFPRRRGGWPKTLEIDADSLRALEQLLVDHTIQIVMTGHLHVPRLTRMTASNDVVDLDILESRCGTTTQQDTYSLAMLAKLRKRPGLPPNSLVVHELLLRDGRPVWRARIYWRSPARGFVCDANHRSSFIPGILVRELPL